MIKHQQPPFMPHGFQEISGSAGFGLQVFMAQGRGRQKRVFYRRAIRVLRFAMV